MKLSGALVKAGLTTAATGVYLYFKKLFKRKKKTKKVTAKNSAKPKSVRKPSVTPRQRKSRPIEDLPMK